MRMAHWLIKSDPETYSFDDLLCDKKTSWDGVRNHQARNNLAAMKVGDSCLVYHSGEEPAIVGTAKVVKSAYPDPKADDPRWLSVDLQAGKRLSRAVPLAEMKKHSVLSKMAVMRQSRLSVSPVTEEEWAAALELGGAKT
jgi:predicted RNA-binding protein with PUA-like domain